MLKKPIITGFVGFPYTTGTRVWANTPSRVRIPPSPPKKPANTAFVGFFIVYGQEAEKTRFAIKTDKNMYGEYMLSTKSPTERQGSSFI